MSSMHALSLILATLATARLTRLTVEDVITERPREAAVRFLVKHRGPESMMAYLITCPWCASMYVGAGVAGAWWAWGDTRWFTAAVGALAFSYVAGFLASREG